MDIDKDRFPEPELLKRASTIQFDDLNKDINVLLAELVCVASGVRPSLRLSACPRAVVFNTSPDMR